MHIRVLEAAGHSGVPEGARVRRTYETNPPTNSRPINPVFRAGSVVLAISAEKDGNLRVV
jgi:hypothetical protein